MAVVRPALEGKIVRQLLTARNYAHNSSTGFRRTGFDGPAGDSAPLCDRCKLSRSFCDGVRLILDSRQGIAFIVGFVLQSLRITFGIVAAGTLVCCIVRRPTRVPSRPKLSNSIFCRSPFRRIQATIRTPSSGCRRYQSLESLQVQRWSRKRRI